MSVVRGVSKKGDVKINNMNIKGNMDEVRTEQRMEPRNMEMLKQQPVK